MPTIDNGWESKAGQKLMAISSTEDGLKPIVLSEVSRVVERAAEAYVATTEAQKHTRSRAKVLYRQRRPGRVRHMGQTAEEVIEEYLAGLGYSRCSRMWLDLSRIVIDHAEQKCTDQPEVAFWCKLNEVPFESEPASLTEEACCASIEGSVALIERKI